MFKKNLHYLLFKWLRGAAYWLTGESFQIIPKGQYDLVPKGNFVFGPSEHFLLVPKNRYRVKLLPDQTVSDKLGVGWITEENSADGYDELWGDELKLQAFRSESDHVREKLTSEIIDIVEDRIQPMANVIDIGCGVGDLLLEVRKRKQGAKLSGLDFSSKAIEGARAVIPDGKFVQCTIDKVLPFESQAYDVVLCTDVLEHLEYPKLIAAELVRICRPDGLVVIVVPDGNIDTFLGHYWFWNEQTLKLLLSDWNAEIQRLPQTREFLACIRLCS